MGVNQLPTTTAAGLARSHIGEGCEKRDSLTQKLWQSSRPECGFPLCFLLRWRACAILEGGLLCLPEYLGRRVRPPLSDSPVPVRVGFNRSGLKSSNLMSRPFHPSTPPVGYVVRCQLAPHTDRWMMGDRFGEVLGTRGECFRVRLDVSGKTVHLHRSSVGEVFNVRAEVFQALSAARSAVA